ncbi:MAG: ABC transporter ATP-binding protein [Acidobacteriota bacterium]
MEEILALQDLTVSFPLGREWVPVVRDAGFGVRRGEFLGLVGESGSGKSITALSVLRLLPANARVDSGQVLLDGVDLLAVGEPEIRSVRGGRIGMIFQEPMTALNPVLTVGFQIAEAVRAHRRTSRRDAAIAAERLMDRVAIPDARDRLKDYPHQLSGGQRQRVMIAMALAADPDILIADEPTTALDVTVQAQIIELLEELRRDLDLAILLITHDLGVVAESCTRVVVMYAGQVVEQGSAEQVFTEPAHPYTRGLLAAIPRLGRKSDTRRLPTIPGQVPEPERLPIGCAFHPRCPEVMEVCRQDDPESVGLGKDRLVRCFLHREPEK